MPTIDPGTEFEVPPDEEAKIELTPLIEAMIKIIDQNTAIVAQNAAIIEQNVTILRQIELLLVPPKLHYSGPAPEWDPNALERILRDHGPAAMKPDLLDRLPDEWPTANAD